MNEVEKLQLKYDALIRTRRDIRRKVKDDLRDEMRERERELVAEKTREIDYQFALDLVGAKEAGMKRADIARAIRTNDHSRLMYFLDLAGSEGFTRGRPKMSDLEKVQNMVGWEILDYRKGLVKFFRLGKFTFSEPVVGLLERSSGRQFTLVSFEGSEVDAWNTYYRGLIKTDRELHSRVKYGELEEIASELMKAGWNGRYVPEREVSEEVEGVDLESLMDLGSRGE